MTSCIHFLSANNQRDHNTWPMGRLERTAYVYMRQSSDRQVREHLESQRRQFALADRAKQSGFAQVTVIDEDLGRSGSGLQERPGFARLLTSVCQGFAGAILAIEASSRLPASTEIKGKEKWASCCKVFFAGGVAMISTPGNPSPSQVLPARKITPE